MCTKTWHKSILKEKEINDELKKINEQIEECKIIESTNKNISNQLKILTKIYLKILLKILLSVKLMRMEILIQRL